MIVKNCFFLVKENIFIFIGGNEIREVDCYSIYGSLKFFKYIEIVFVLEGLDLFRNKKVIFIYFISFVLYRKL